MAVQYYFNIFNFVSEVPAFAAANEGVQGQPLPMLNYKSGSGNALTSGRPDGVGAVITGLINFPNAGLYRMVAQSNDGVQVTIGNRLIASDPDVHADRFTQIVAVRLDDPGWYPIRILYFEKRNTSTLQLFWLKPTDTGGLKLVPANAFAHLP